MKFSKIYIISLAAIVLVVGCAIGYFLHGAAQGTTLSAPVEVRENQSQYQFVNPLLLISTSKDLYVKEYSNLVSSLSSYIDRAKAEGKAVDTSVYFREINSGHWTGIGENDKYHPSSMLKVITLIAAAQLAENGSLSLSSTLQYEPDSQTSQFYPANDSLSAGPHSIQELATDMIVYSDNGANAALLSDSAINDEFTALYKIFRLPAATSSTDDFMSPKSYSVVWRSLYNGTLLSDETSNQVLQLLSRTAFNEGLVDGVPASTTVSHKFGEYTYETTAGSIIDRELHDCGIVYYPGDPYFICVMTKGQDFTNLQGVISDISKIAYDFVAQKNGSLGERTHS